MSTATDRPLLTKEIRDMYKMVCGLLVRSESFVFREPVDWKGMGLNDYPDIVKHPMDLGTIKANIENRKYNSADEIAEDIRLVWSNCMLYNRDGCEVSYVILFGCKNRTHLDNLVLSFSR